MCQEVLVLLPAISDLVVQLGRLKGTEVGGVAAGDADAIIYTQ